MKLDGIEVWSCTEGSPHPETGHVEDNIVGGVGLGEFGVEESFSLLSVVDVVGVVCQLGLHVCDIDDITCSVVDGDVVEGVQMMWECGIYSQVSHSQYP